MINTTRHTMETDFYKRRKKVEEDFQTPDVVRT